MPVSPIEEGILAGLELRTQLWLLPKSTKLIFDTGDSFAQLANFALRSDLTSQNGVLKGRHQCLLVRPNL